MNRPDRQKLDGYFAKARTEPPATSEEEILALLDGSGMSGRGSLRPGQKAHNIFNRNRGRTMKVIAFTLIAASLGSAAVYFNTQQQEQRNMTVLNTTAPQKAAPAVPQVDRTDMSDQSHQAPAVQPLQRTQTTPTIKPTATQKAPAPSEAPAAERTPQNNTLPQPAQAPDHSDMKLDSALGQELGQMLSKVAADYWVEKINSYRTRIDRMLTPDHRAELNTLRVRWSFAMAQDQSSGDEDMKASISIGDKDKVRTPSGKDKSSSFELSLGMSSSSDGDTDVSANSKINGMDMDHKAALNMVMAMMIAKGDERAIIIKSTKDMAENYRPQLDGLKETIFNDVVGFVTIVAEGVNHFVAEHQSEFSSDNADSLTTKVNAMRHSFTSEQVQKVMGTLYDFLGEPLLMLYNGAEIGGLIPASIAAPVPGMTMVESNALRQSVPNPASSQATISYVLNEPSSATTLRLYDASGRLIVIRDQGAQPAGEHSSALDVSALAPGTYLYHLTVQTAKGEQVFSKTLQVAR